MADALNYPYRRFSSEIYAVHLAELLEENEIPSEITGEPEGLSSVVLGAATVPGVIVMVSASDVDRIRSLEKMLAPQLHDTPREAEEEEPVAGHWILLGYLFALLGAPIAAIAGIHLFTSRRRNRDHSTRYAYDERARFHGKLIFWFALAILVFSFARLIMGARMSFLDSMSFVLWQLDQVL